MPGIMHHVMGRAAWRSLSVADREAWALSPAVPPNAPAFLQQENFVSVEDKIARYSAFLDLMGWRTAGFRVGTMRP